MTADGCVASACAIRLRPELYRLDQPEDISEALRPGTQFRRDISEVAMSVLAVGLQRSLPGKLAEGV